MTGTIPEGLRPVPPGRVPPHSLDAERCVLGGILLDREQLDDVAALITPSDFYRDAHRKIFEAMLAIDADKEPLDRVTVKDRLREMGALEAIGGESFVDLLDTVVPSAANLAYYATIVREKALGRRLIEAAHVISSQGYEQSAPVGELLDDAERRIFAVTETRSDLVESITGKQLVISAFKGIEQRFEKKAEMVGVPSGLVELDKLTHGFRKGHLVIVAARPSMGKTSFLLGILMHVAAQAKLGAGLFSLEQPREEIGDKSLTMVARVDNERVATGNLRDMDFSNLAKAAGVISDSGFLLDDTPAISLFDLRSRARRMKKKLADQGRELAVIGVDYLQLMATSTDAETRNLAIGELTKGLKALAKELAIPVIALSQLNRDLEKRPNKRPMMSDLRESGNIENDADVILFLYRHEVYAKADEDAKGKAEVIVGKNRGGAQNATADVAFHKSFTLFDNLPDPFATRQPELFGEPPPHTDADAPPGAGK